MIHNLTASFRVVGLDQFATANIKVVGFKVLFFVKKIPAYQQRVYCVSSTPEEVR